MNRFDYSADKIYLPRVGDKVMLNPHLMEEGRDYVIKRFAGKTGRVVSEDMGYAVVVWDGFEITPEPARWSHKFLVRV